MCNFCTDIESKINEGDFYVLKYILKLKKRKIAYSNPIYGYSKTRLIPMNMICEARRQFENNGINGIDTIWFQNTFKKSIKNSPCSLKFLKAIVLSV